MRFMIMHKLDEHRPELWQPDPAFIARMGAFMAEANQAGCCSPVRGCGRAAWTPAGSPSPVAGPR